MPVVVRKLRAAAGATRTIVAIAVVVAAIVGGRAIPRVGVAIRPDLVLYVENAAFFLWLAALFATSLVGGGDALVTRMARRVRRGDMPPAVVRYTRRVTVAWAVFFVSTIALSSALFFDASRDAWSLFVNLLIWPLVGAAFVVEYAIRSIVLRDVDHVPFTAALRAFRDRDVEAADP